MSRPGLRRLLSFCLPAILLLAAIAPAQSPTRRYRIIDLGHLGGGESEAFAINDKGEIVGQSLRAVNGPLPVPFHWRRGLMIDLIPGAMGGWAQGINNSGQIVGTYKTSASGLAPFLAFLHKPSSGLSNLPGSEAMDINDAGQIALRIPNPNNLFSLPDSYVVSPGGTLTFIGPLTRAKAISATGNAVGEAGIGSATQGFIYDFANGTITFLNNSIERMNAAGDYVACCIRQQVGAFTFSSSVVKDDQGTRDLGVLGGFAGTTATAINDNRQIVGVAAPFSGGLRAVMKDRPDAPWVLLDSLLPPGSGWALNRAHDINNRGEIVGLGRFNGQNRAFLLTPLFCSSADDIDANGDPDNDGDGLCDSWETNGMDLDGDGNVELDLPSIGANPNHKDLFVEIDYMSCAASGSFCAPGDTHGHRPSFQAMIDVRAAFAAAPVSNPDGATGITLHFFIDEPVREFNPISLVTDLAGDADDFNDLKLGNPQNACGTGDFDGHFGSLATRSLSASDCQKALAARALVYRYAIFAHDHIDPGVAGQAELPGNDLVILRSGTASPKNTAAVFMHEFGHNLNLMHGGGDHRNCKPNYLSIMNYALALDKLDPTRPLDYSRQPLPSLDEQHLDEPVGIQGPAGRFTIFGDTTGRIWRGNADRPINWNGDGINFVADPTDLDVAVNINRVHTISACNFAGLTVLAGHDDWQNLLYDFKNSPDFSDLPVRSTVPAEPEMPLQEIIATAQIFDFDEDGIPNIPDNCPADPNPLQTDSNGNGIGDACDAPVNQNPVAAAGVDQTVEATSAAGATVALDGSASIDPDGNSLTFAWTGPFGTLTGASIGPVLPIGTHIITLTVDDGNGGTSTDTIQVIVRDTTPPVVTAPPNQVIEATSTTGAAAVFSATATDIVGGTITPACVPASGSVFALGTLTVTCTATDPAGNTGSATFTVTVRDTTPPAVTVPPNQVVEATSTAGAAAVFSATATDLVGGTITPACVPVSGSVFALGTRTVTCTATDPAANTGSATFTVTVRDTTPPAVTAPAGITVVATELAGARPNAAPGLLAFLGAGSAVDLADPAPVRLTPQVAGLDATPTTLFPIGPTAVTFRFADASGNTGAAAATVTVVAPDFSLGVSSNAAAVDIGSSTSIVFTVTPQPAPYNSAVTFSCGSLPRLVSCSFHPPTVTPGSSPASSTLTISVARAIAPPGQFPLDPRLWVMLLLVALARAAMVTLRSLAPIKPVLRGCVVALLFVFGLCLPGCGGGAVPSPNLAVGLHSITVTASSGSAQHSTVVQLAVR